MPDLLSSARPFLDRHPSEGWDPWQCNFANLSFANEMDASLR